MELHAVDFCAVGLAELGRPDGYPGRVVAVFDWEMATLGDPLADLGYTLARERSRA